MYTLLHQLIYVTNIYRIDVEYIYAISYKVYPSFVTESKWKHNMSGNYVLSIKENMNQQYSSIKTFTFIKGCEKSVIGKPIVHKEAQKNAWMKFSSFDFHSEKENTSRTFFLWFFIQQSIVCLSIKIFISI